MKFSPNKTPIEIIKEGVFGGAYFRGIYSCVNGKWYGDSLKKFNDLKHIDQEYYSSNHHDVKLNKYQVKTGTSLRFWESKGWIDGINHYG